MLGSFIGPFELGDCDGGNSPGGRGAGSVCFVSPAIETLSDRDEAGSLATAHRGVEKIIVGTKTDSTAGDRLGLFFEKGCFANLFTSLLTHWA